MVTVGPPPSAASRPRRRRRERETPEIAGGLRRWLRALGARVADEDPWSLPDLVAVREAAEAAEIAAVRGQRQRFSWQEIADGLGQSKQRVQQYYGRRGVA